MQRRPALRASPPTPMSTNQKRAEAVPALDSLSHRRRHSSAVPTIPKFYNAFFPLLTSEASDWNSYSSVSKKLAALDRAVTVVRHRRNAVVSSRRSDPTRRVPDHVLGLIFQYTCPPVPLDLQVCLKSLTHYHRYTAITLGSVSSRWRITARSLPELWTVASVDVTETNVRSTTKLLRLYLQLSNDLPVHLEIRWKYHDPKSVANWTKLWDRIASVVFTKDCTERIMSLRLESPPSPWIAQKLSAQTVPLFPSLQNLIISNPESGMYIHPQCHSPQLEATKLDLSMLARHIATSYPTHSNFVINPDCYTPSLERLTLENAIPPLKFSWYTITTLRLRHLHPAECADLLFRCKNLVEFDCSQPDVWSKILAPVKLNNITILPCLQYFRWSYGSGQFDQFLAFLRLPALRRFHWEPASIWVGHDIVGPFLERLPLEMETFELTGAKTCDLRFLKTILYGRHGLKEVTLRQCWLLKRHIVKV
ncbi:hypothetical protein P691DRAFT_807115 [Macrolepiota fuliginosa MF-IS2]|uniref:F-box domain-containing protein n=1 Tax=Macrolepiota fuliginosa MF-IS2 TaxID=1400762 RepID=A0A9P6C0H5_9AGAR|nr:hypothetical protein P691DRAFT_807115 [Macrolepiota fuliginosa MF-IS2]